MRNMLDTLGGRKWRIWCRDLGKAGNQAMEFAAEDSTGQKPGWTGEEERLAFVGTAITRDWAILRERLRTIYDERFNDRDIADLKEESTKRRLEAIGAASLVRTKNEGRGFYQPYYNEFEGMVEKQVELWDHLLELCDTQNPQCLEDTVRCLEWCELAGEDALVRLPSTVST